MALGLILTLESSYTSINLSAHITDDYGEKARDPGCIKLFSHFTRLMAFCVSKNSERDSVITTTYDEDLWQSQVTE